jgi:hypothetical protein
MDAHELVDEIETAIIDNPSIDSSMDEPAEALPAKTVTEEHFEEIVLAALDCVGGTMLFKMTTGADDEARHVAAGAVHEGDARHFLILSMPVAGGPLRVEQAANSKSPIAAIAVSYASLADAFGTA